jgi:hypothetical protein
MKIAIIGTREPVKAQLDNISAFLNGMSPNQDVIISGCAYGVDAYALKIAKALGYKTIGCVPWEKYNVDIQQLCDTIIVFNADRDIIATRSVKKYHPIADQLSQGAFRLHARNYLIVHDCDLVMAYPGPTGGGTMQGIKIATDLGIEVAVNPHLSPET